MRTTKERRTLLEIYSLWLIGSYEYHGEAPQPWNNVATSHVLIFIVRNTFLKWLESRGTWIRIKKIRSKLYRIAYAWCHHAPLAAAMVEATLRTAWQNVWQLKQVDALKRWLLGIFRDYWCSAVLQQNLILDIEMPSARYSDELPARETDLHGRLGNKGKKIPCRSSAWKAAGCYLD